MSRIGSPGLMTPAIVLKCVLTTMPVIGAMTSVRVSTSPRRRCVAAATWFSFD